MPTVVDLGQKVKAKYPGMYDDLPDADVGRKVQAKYPTQYADFTDPLTSQKVNGWKVGPETAPPPSGQIQPPGVLDRFFGKGLNPMFHSLDALSDSSTPWSERTGNVANAIPFVQPLKESIHAFNRLTGIEPSGGSSTARDLLRSVPVVGPMVQQPFEQMGSGDVAGGLGSIAQDVLGLKLARGASRSLHYPEPIQPVEEGVRNIWNPTSKKNAANTYNPKAGEFIPPPVSEPGGTLTHAVRAATPDVVQGAAKLGGGLVVSHFLPHWAQAMMGYPEYSGAKQIGEGLSKGYQAYTPPPVEGARMMNVTPFDLGAPEPPSVLPEWQPPQLGIPAVGIPATATPRGAMPGGIHNIPPPATPPVRWTPPPEYQNILPTPLNGPPPVEPIPATVTPRGAVPGGPHNVPAPVPLPVRYVAPVQTGPSPAPDLSPVQPIPATVTPSGRTIPSVGERVARASTPTEPTVTVNVDTPAGVKKVQVPASAITAPPPAVGPSARAIALTKGAAVQPAGNPLTAPVGGVAPTQAVLPKPVSAAPLGATAPANAPVTLEDQLRASLPPEMAALVPAEPPPAAQPSGLLQNLIKTVQSSPDKNAETIAEHAGNIGHTLTTNKNATIAQHLLGQGINADAWDALPMEEKNAWIKKVNAAQKTKYKPFGADFGPGRYGRSAEEGARQVGDAMRVLGTPTPPSAAPPMSNLFAPVGSTGIMQSTPGARPAISAVIGEGGMVKPKLALVAPRQMSVGDDVQWNPKSDPSLTFSGKVESVAPDGTLSIRRPQGDIVKRNPDINPTKLVKETVNFGEPVKLTWDQDQAIRQRADSMAWIKPEQLDKFRDAVRQFGPGYKGVEDRVNIVESAMKRGEPVRESLRDLFSSVNPAVVARAMGWNDLLPSKSGLSAVPSGATLFGIPKR